MKLFLKKCLTFGLFAAPVYVGLVIFWGAVAWPGLNSNVNYIRAPKGHVLTRLREVKSMSEPDLLIVGSSHAYRGFDVRIFRAAGYSCFNLGTSSQTPIQTRLLLRRYIDRIRPRVLIFEVSPLLFSNDGVESALELIANDRNDLETVKMIWNIPHIKVINTALFGFAHDFLCAGDTLPEAPRKGADTYIPGGYVEQDMSHWTPEPLSPRILRPRPVQIRAFRDVLAMCSKRNIPVFLIQAPVSEKLNRSLINEADFDSLMSASGPYWNFNGLAGLVDSLDFSDEHHLNQKGVTLFNHALIDTLQRHGLLSFRR